MSNYHIKIRLLSDTTFGRGDGVAGLIDQEVEHDSHGFPYLRGRTLKGLLREECDNLVTVLSDRTRPTWIRIVNDLFGVPGSELNTIAHIRIGDACLPIDLREAVAREAVAIEMKPIEMKQSSNILTPFDILSSLTSFRRQTAIDPVEGVAKDTSLRSSRVIVRELCFSAPIGFDIKPTNQMLALLAAGTLALRRMGSLRNRGRGHVKCSLWNETKDITNDYLKIFEQETKV